MPSLFRDVSQRMLADPYRHFGTACRPHLYGQRTLERTYRLTRKSCKRLRAIPEELTTFLLTYLLHAARSTVLLEKLTGFQLVKKFPAFYGTRSFITAFTSARHLSLS